MEADILNSERGNKLINYSEGVGNLFDGRRRNLVREIIVVFTMNQWSQSGCTYIGISTYSAYFEIVL